MSDFNGDTRADRWRRHYGTKASDHVTDPPRFYLTVLFLTAILMIVGILLIMYDMATGLKLELYWKLVYFMLVGIPPMWIAGFYIPYNQEASKAPVGIPTNGSIFTFRLEDISKLYPVMDESGDGLLRQIIFLRWLPRNGVPGWPYAYGGGHHGFLIVPQAHIRYKLDENEEWKLDNAWSLHRGEFIREGILYVKMMDKEGKEIVHAIPNIYSYQQIVDVFANERPYYEKGQGKFIFPFDERAIPHAEIPDQLIGSREIPKGIRIHSRFKDSSPVYMAWDLAPEYGGPGMNLPSHAEVRFGANERVTKEQSTTITDQRLGLVVQEKLAHQRQDEERKEWEKEHT